MCSDGDVRDEAFLEYINQFLGTGEVSGMFSRDELDALASEVRPQFLEAQRASALSAAAAAAGSTASSSSSSSSASSASSSSSSSSSSAAVPLHLQPDTPDSLLAFLASRVRDRLHVLLCLSPVGPRFAARVSQFPAIFSKCTVDWFLPWPADALAAVADAALAAGFPGGAAGGAAAAEEEEEEEEAAEGGASQAAAGSTPDDNDDNGGDADDDAGAPSPSPSSPSASSPPSHEPKLRMACSRKVRRALPRLAASVHAAVGSLCDELRSSRNRSAHVTPRSYLNFLDGFVSLYASRLASAREQEASVRAGLAKMAQAKLDVAEMRTELSAKEKELAAAGEAAEALLADISASTAAAEREKAAVQAIVESVTAQAEAIAAVKDGAARDLAAAKPALDAALAALSSITPKDIGALKALKNPPDVIKRIFDCVLLLRRFSVARVSWQVVKGSAVICGDYEAAVRMMGDTQFLSALVNFPKEAITDETVELLQPYFAAPDFNYESAKKVSSVFVVGWGGGGGGGGGGGSGKEGKGGEKKRERECVLLLSLSLSLQTLFSYLSLSPSRSKKKKKNCYC